MTAQYRPSRPLTPALLAGLALLILSWVWAQDAQPGTAMQPAIALVARVTGEATYTDYALGEEGRIEPRMKFKQGVTINTGPEASVVLLFSNGSSLTIKPGTTLAIEEYLQAPLPEDAPSLDALDREPTTSKTKLRLLEGDIIGSVKKLNRDGGSSYEVESPIGTAGIRGTNYSFSTRIRGVQTPQGQFGISVGNGVFIPIGNAQIPVGDLEQVTFAGTFNADGSITITSFQAGGMPQAVASQINVSATQAQALFAEFGASDFNPNQAGVQGGQFNMDVIYPPAPQPPVTPNQGE